MCNVQCSYCDSENVDVMSHEEDFTVYRCEDCGDWFESDQPVQNKKIFIRKMKKDLDERHS